MLPKTLEFTLKDKPSSKLWNAIAFVYSTDNVRASKGAFVKGFLLPVNTMISEDEKSIASCFIAERHSVLGSVMERVILNNGVQGYAFKDDLNKHEKFSKIRTIID